MSLLLQFPSIVRIDPMLACDFGRQLHIQSTHRHIRQARRMLGLAPEIATIEAQTCDIDLE